eukprot:scaffold116201_cov15-Tisochrysis_lutea.AAC.1
MLRMISSRLNLDLPAKSSLSVSLCSSKAFLLIPPRSRSRVMANNNNHHPPPSPHRELSQAIARNKQALRKQERALRPKFHLQPLPASWSNDPNVSFASSHGHALRNSHKIPGPACLLICLTHPVFLSRWHLCQSRLIGLTSPSHARALTLQSLSLFCTQFYQHYPT